MRTQRVELEPSSPLLDGLPAGFARPTYEVVLAEVLGREPGPKEAVKLPVGTQMNVYADGMNVTIDVYEGWRSGFSVCLSRVPGTTRLSIVIEPASRTFLYALVLDTLVLGAALVLRLTIESNPRFNFVVLGLGVTVMIPIAFAQALVGRWLNTTSAARLERLRHQLVSRLR